MQDLNLQAPPSTPEADAMQAPPAQEANAGLPADVQQFVVQQPAAEGNAMQPPPQGQMSAQQRTEADAHWQKIAQERLVQQYQLQQEVERLRQESLARQQQTQSPNQNPYDANQDWQSWIKWEQQAAARVAAQEAISGIMGFAQQQAAIQQEQQWAAQHPNVDIMQVKAFQKMRGIQNMDDAYTLMTMPMMMNSVQTQAAQQTINQFRQPQVGASAVRAGQAEGQTLLSYEGMLRAYNANPKVEDSWPQSIRDMFWKETYGRQAAGR